MIIDSDFSKTILENLYDGVYFVDCDKKILYWNKGAENISGYTSSEVIGKQCSDNTSHINEHGIQLCMTECPLAKTVADSIPREMNLYIRHKKEHRVPVEQSGFSLYSDIVQVTVSIGATLAQPKDTTETLLERADKLLYYSKANGRNRVSIKQL